jgi:hypothetical protein
MAIDSQLISGNETMTDLHPLVQAQNDKLRAHLITDYKTAHKGFVLSDKDFSDSRGDLVGRNSLTIYVDGRKYTVPCDPRKEGPPILPSITVEKPVTLRIHSEADTGKVGVSVELICAVEGTLPIKLRWQGLKGTRWSDLQIQDVDTGEGLDSVHNLGIGYEGANTSTLFIKKAIPGLSEDKLKKLLENLVDPLGIIPFSIFGTDDEDGNCHLRLTAWNDANTSTTRVAGPEIYYSHTMEGEDGIFDF